MPLPHIVSVTQVVMKPTVSNGLREQVAKLVKSSEVVTTYDGTGQVPVGTNCKNNGCKQVSIFSMKMNLYSYIILSCSIVGPIYL